MDGVAISDPALSIIQRIAILKKKMQDVRKTYVMVKAEMASIDRRKKKLRRRDREIKKNVQKQMQQQQHNLQLLVQADEKLQSLL